MSELKTFISRVVITVEADVFVSAKDSNEATLAVRSLLGSRGIHTTFVAHAMPSYETQKPIPMNVPAIVLDRTVENDDVAV